MPRQASHQGQGDYRISEARSAVLHPFADPAIQLGQDTLFFSSCRLTLRSSSDSPLSAKMNALRSQEAVLDTLCFASFDHARFPLESSAAVAMAMPHRWAYCFNTGVCAATCRARYQPIQTLALDSQDGPERMRGRERAPTPGDLSKAGSRNRVLRH
ncbi:hypothetical protein D9M69_563900 [compost metagenome]